MTGRIVLDGTPLDAYSLAALSRKRAVLSQSSFVNFPFSVLEIVMMGRSPYIGSQATGSDAVVIREVLENVDAWHLQQRIFPTLSGGERQRVHLARVLAQMWDRQHTYLFLDEPTTALDLKHQHQILRLTRRIAQERNMAVCLILHDLNLAMQYADQGRTHARRQGGCVRRDSRGADAPQYRHRIRGARAGSVWQRDTGRRANGGADERRGA